MNDPPKIDKSLEEPYTIRGRGFRKNTASFVAWILCLAVALAVIVGIVMYAKL